MLVPAKKKERAMIRRAGAPMARASGLARKAERSRGEASRESSRAPDRERTAVNCWPKRTEADTRPECPGPVVIAQNRIRPLLMPNMGMKIKVWSLK